MSYLKTLTAVEHTSAGGLQKELLDTAKKQVGFIPNMYANMVNAPAVLSTYLHGYGRFRGESGFAPAEQDVVFLAVRVFVGAVQHPRATFARWWIGARGVVAPGTARTVNVSLLGLFCFTSPFRATF